MREHIVHVRRAWTRPPYMTDEPEHVREVAAAWQHEHGGHGRHREHVHHHVRHGGWPGGGGGHGGPGGPGGRGRGRGPRVGKGDVRAATLLLLAEQPLHGYQIIQLIDERSGGLWRPSAGSIY